MTYCKATAHNHLRLGIDIIRQAEHLVSIVATIEADIELYVAFVDCMDIQLNLNTLVRHRSTIDIVVTITERWINEAWHQHIIGIFIEIVELHIHVFIKREFKTEVHLLRALPSQVRITLTSPNITYVTINVVDCIAVSIKVRRNTLVTKYTP